MGFRMTSNTAGMTAQINDDAKRDMWIRGVGEQMLGNMRLSFANSPATGKAYDRGTKTHIASSPSNPPRVDDGTLSASLDLIKLQMKAYSLQTSVKHGLETEIGIGMAPRPWMRPEFIAARIWMVAEAVGGALI